MGEDTDGGKREREGGRKLGLGVWGWGDGGTKGGPGLAKRGVVCKE